MKCQEVNYQADSALSYTCFDEKGNVQTANCIYEKEAAYKGGDKAWFSYLTKNLSAAKYPEEYYQGKAYGTVYIQFIVDVDGKIIEPKALNSVHHYLDEIALNIIRQSPRWEPAVQYNRNVKAYRKQPITFAKVQ
jgi:protein TonB